jgi:cardiolipin synthase
MGIKRKELSGDASAKYITRKGRAAEDRVVQTQSGESHEFLFFEKAFNRATGTSPVLGNAVRILKDAAENYPAWLDAIRSAEKTIHFESYILRDDKQGHLFADALAERARAGVKVRLLYDWLGGLGKTSQRFWRDLANAGVEVRGFNPPFFDSPFGWLSRDHRKMLTVDGRVGFVSGLCVGDMWAGDPERGIDPWRDTGVEVLGPGVADIEQAFTQTWAAVGSPIPQDEIPSRSSIPPAGDVRIRVIATTPNSSWLYRLDQMIAAGADETLWLTDAYFAGTTGYIQAMQGAAMDGADVRLLVPQSSDIPVMRALSRVGYRPLLEAGVRVFEWNGPMLHAKTAVADGKWARIGSSNLNLASWMGNWELDVVIEDERLAQEMEQLYLEDLTNATEIVLSERRRIRTRVDSGAHPVRRRFLPGSSGRAAAGAFSIGSAVGAVIGNRRILGPAEARALSAAGVLLLIFVVIGVVWPRWISIPVAMICLWLAISLLMRALKLYRQGKQGNSPEPLETAERVEARPDL